MSLNRLRAARPATVIRTLAVSGVSLAIVTRLIMGNASAESNAPTKVFKGGPAFVSLPLESSEQVNHNTKRLRFKLPQRDDVSGLPLTCKCPSLVCWYLVFTQNHQG
jgi:cytochrome-b5 reductase